MAKKAKRAAKPADDGTVRRLTPKVLRNGSAGSVSIYGVATGSFQKDTIFGTVTGFKGTFEGLDAAGKLVKSSRCFLPAPATADISAQLAEVGHDGIKFRVNVAADDGCRFSVDPANADPLAELREQA